ncbi:DUF202 domain-containing protein [Pseudodesulfovibrio sp.]|nr:DUF202 domain-containing protein [Pseudodesulfovibrio sp.]
MADNDKDFVFKRAELAEERTVEAEERTDLATERTELARERNELAKNRTRLANKRTFLAWCRTALSFMTFGFLLEKIDAYLVSEHMSVTNALLSELGTLGKFTFIFGPILMLFAGWRYYRLEKEIGFQKGGLYVFPEIVLFSVILGAALIFVFF